MTQSIATHSATSVHADHSHEAYSRTLFGFWVYLMTDCLLFGTLFAVYGILHTQTFGGPPASELFSLPFALAETLILLASSFVIGVGMLSMSPRALPKILIGMGVTFLLGAAFLALELTEFTKLAQEGNSWERSAFLSSYFTLVATHGLHITFGLLWMLVMMIQLVFRGITLSTIRRLACLRMFWHFLDVVWIFIFAVVYLMGAK